MPYFKVSVKDTVHRKAGRPINKVSHPIIPQNTRINSTNVKAGTKIQPQTIAPAA